VPNSSSTAPLARAEKIGFVGDLHGDMEHVLIAARTLHDLGVKVIIVTGDFGFIWPRINYRRSLDKLSSRLNALDITLYFVDGNHEWFPELLSYAQDQDGLRSIRDNVIHLPRGYRIELTSGAMFAALGGANSIDRDLRKEGLDWWPEESITETDLALLGSELVDVLVGHDAPLGLRILDQFLDSTKSSWAPDMVRYSHEGRAQFHKGFAAVRPRIYIGGHYHYFVNERISIDGASGPLSRVLLLDTNGPKSTSLAVLTVATLELVAFDRLGQGQSST